MMKLVKSFLTLLNRGFMKNNLDSAPKYYYNNDKLVKINRFWRNGNKQLEVIFENDNTFVAKWFNNCGDLQKIDSVRDGKKHGLFQDNYYNEKIFYFCGREVSEYEFLKLRVIEKITG